MARGLQMALGSDVDRGTQGARDQGLLEEQTIQERLVSEMTLALRRLEANTRAVFGSAIVDKLGFPIAWDLKGGTQQATVGLIGAAFRSLLLRSSTILDLGGFSSGLVKFDKGYLGVFELGVEDLYLVVLAGSQANVMDLLLETQNVLRELRDVLGSG